MMQLIHSIIAADRLGIITCCHTNEFSTIAVNALAAETQRLMVVDAA